MKPQELNQDDQKNINGGSGLLDGFLGGDDNRSGHSGSNSNSGSGADHNSRNDDEGSSSLPIVGDLLDI